MGGDPAAAAQANQQFNQQQAEQYLTQQKASAIQGLQDYLSKNPDPASQWGAIAQPNFSYSPSAIGGGTTNSAGGIAGALGGWTPTPPQGTPPLKLLQQMLAPTPGGGGSSTPSPGKSSPVGGGLGGTLGGDPTAQPGHFAGNFPLPGKLRQ